MKLRIMDDECETCSYATSDGRCAHGDARADYGDCGHYEGCTGWWPKEKEANDANA